MRHSILREMSDWSREVEILRKKLTGSWKQQLVALPVVKLGFDHSFRLFKATKELGEKRKVCLMVTSATPATSAISRWDFLSALAWEYSVNDVFSIDIIIKELCRHLEDINVLVR